MFSLLFLLYFTGRVVINLLVGFAFSKINRFNNVMQSAVKESSPAVTAEVFAARFSFMSQRGVCVCARACARVRVCV